MVGQCSTPLTPSLSKTMKDVSMKTPNSRKTSYKRKRGFRGNQFLGKGSKGKFLKVGLAESKFKRVPFQVSGSVAARKLSFNPTPNIPSKINIRTCTDVNTSTMEAVYPVRGNYFIDLEACYLFSRSLLSVGLVKPEIWSYGIMAQNLRVHHT